LLDDVGETEDHPLSGLLDLAKPGIQRFSAPVDNFHVGKKSHLQINIKLI
jgi:hypothetical protein